jgi:hypothetical protein
LLSGVIQKEVTKYESMKKDFEWLTLLLN